MNSHSLYFARSFGAKGDGIAKDTAALQATIANYDATRIRGTMLILR